MPKPFGDVEGIILTVAFVLIIIAIAEASRKVLRLGRSFTRKIIHVGVGNWVFMWPFAFENWYAVLVPPSIFTVLNYVSYKRELFKAMEREEKAGGLGTVYYAVSNAILAPLAMYLGKIWVAASSIALMAWADGLADAFGRRFGRHRYTVMGSQRSLEGSIGFFAVGSIAVLVTLAYFSTLMGVELAIPIYAVAPTISGLGALIEALSPRGADNLTVPLISSLVLLLLS